MPSFRQWKERLGREILPPFWPLDAGSLPEPLGSLVTVEAVGPLLSFLPRGGILKWRAVLLLGRVVSAVAERDMETARDVMRRCMWHLNEDSGNLGWGIPEAMGEIVARSPALAAEYGKIVLSYANDTGKADNHIDFAPLKRGVYWAIGRAARSNPALRREAFALLADGLSGEDGGTAGAAAWGIGMVAAVYAPERAERERAMRALAALDSAGTSCDILEGLVVREKPARVFAREAREALTR